MTATDIAGAGSQQSTVTPGDSKPGGIGSRGPDDDPGTESIYHLKWIQWNSVKIPIVMQSRNGPCPLIATMNVLLLREKVKFPDMLEQISDNQLLTYLGECFMDYVPADSENDENAILNLEQNIHDAIEILPKLKTGLDVNIRFTGITDFEYTPECIIFDLLRIPLYHGWLSDPDLNEVQNAIGNQSYNQLVDNIITNKTSTDPDIMAKVLISEDFLERTASQLTHHGLMELKCNINENEIGILFRNNHFLTILKREGEIYTLVTDHGYLTEDNIIWETLDNIDGAGRFFDSNFQSSDITKKQVSVYQEIDQRQQQLENDFLMALSLKEEETTDSRRIDETGPVLPHWGSSRDQKLSGKEAGPSWTGAEYPVTQALEAILYDEGFPPLSDQQNDSSTNKRTQARSSTSTYPEDSRSFANPSSTATNQPIVDIESKELNQHPANVIGQSRTISDQSDAITAHRPTHLEEDSAPQMNSQGFNQTRADHHDDETSESQMSAPMAPPSVTSSQGSSVATRRPRSERSLKESSCIVN